MSKNEPLAVTYEFGLPEGKLCVPPQGRPFWVDRKAELTDEEIKRVKEVNDLVKYAIERNGS